MRTCCDLAVLLLTSPMTGQSTLASFQRAYERVAGENIRLRHYLARLHRKTLCYSKLEEMLRHSIRLLLHYLKFWDVPFRYDSYVYSATPKPQAFEAEALKVAKMTSSLSKISNTESSLVNSKINRIGA